MCCSLKGRFHGGLQKTYFHPETQKPHEDRGALLICYIAVVLDVTGGNVNRAIRDRWLDEVVVRIFYTDHLSQGLLRELLEHPKSSLMRQL
jgi:hypothetical protein